MHKLYVNWQHIKKDPQSQKTYRLAGKRCLVTKFYSGNMHFPQGDFQGTLNGYSLNLCHIIMCHDFPFLLETQ